MTRNYIIVFDYIIVLETKQWLAFCKTIQTNNREDLTNTKHPLAQIERDKSTSIKQTPKEDYRVQQMPDSSRDIRFTFVLTPLGTIAKSLWP